MASEVEDTLKRIQSHRGVIGTIVVNNEGSYSSTISTPISINLVINFTYFFECLIITFF